MEIISGKTKWRNLIKLTKYDFIVGGLMALSNLVMWALLGKSAFKSTLSYGDGYKYAFVSKHFYKSVGSVCYYSILPMTPLILTFFRFLCFGNIEIAAAIYVMITAILSSLAFYRFLIVMKIKSPEFFACILPVFTFRYAAIHTVLNSDSLFLFFAFIALTSIKIHNKKVAFVATSLSLLTNYQGIVLAISLFLFYIYSGIKKNGHFSKSAILFLSSLLFLVPVQIFQSLTSKSLFSLFKEKYITSKEFSKYPLESFIYQSSSISHLGSFHILFLFYFIGIIGVQFTSESLLVYIVGITFYIYSFFLKLDKLFDNTILFEILVVIIGFHQFVLMKKTEMTIFLVFYYIIIIFVSYKSILLNSRK